MRIDRVKFATALARADLNVLQLSERTGLSRVTISGIKNGKTCSRESALKLAKVLGDDIIEDAAGAATVKESQVK